MLGELRRYGYPRLFRDTNSRHIHVLPAVVVFVDREIGFAALGGTASVSEFSLAELYGVVLNTGRSLPRMVDTGLGERGVWSLRDFLLIGAPQCLILIEKNGILITTGQSRLVGWSNGALRRSQRMLSCE